jgi:hypothetical protein
MIFSIDLEHPCARPLPGREKKMACIFYLVLNLINTTFKGWSSIGQRRVPTRATNELSSTQAEEMSLSSYLNRHSLIKQKIVD